MNNLDKQYTDLLKDILENGTTKSDRTGTGTISVFGRTIRHKMSDGFPLLTTKKMYTKGIITELLWFLRGDTNIKWLLENDCNIWVGDCYKRFSKEASKIKEAYEDGDMLGIQPNIEAMFSDSDKLIILTEKEFIDKIKTDNKFAIKWDDIGPGYGRKWRNWESIQPKIFNHGANGWQTKSIDQIANIINTLKTNPDSRRMILTAWDPSDVDECLLPPCHYGFQVYTRELSLDERTQYKKKRDGIARTFAPYTHQMLDNSNIPTRAVSLMWNQRSVDTPLGLPFNIASYGLLLEIIAKMVNMVPDELIGNLGDTHIYLNQVEGCKEQIGRELSLDERMQIWQNQQDGRGEFVMECLDNISKRTREPFPLPTLNINTEFWPTENGSCGEGPIDAMAVLRGFSDDNFYKCLIEEDIQISNYQSHTTIKFPLSN